MPKIRVHQLDPADGAPGDVPQVSSDGAMVVFGPTPGLGLYREVLMETGVSAPPAPLESSDGGDWLYGIPPRTGALP